MRLLTGVERWLPDTGTWVTCADLPFRRLGCQQLLLPSGEPILVGGDEETTRADTWVFRDDAWRADSSMIRGRYAQGTLRLANGSLFVVGGLRNEPDEPLTAIASVERRSQDGTWRELAPLPLPMAEPSLAEIEGGVLACGGYDDELSRRCFVFRGGAWTEVAPLSQPRGGHSAVVLRDGRVLVLGGQEDFSPESAIAHGELWDPATDRWTPVEGPRILRHGHSTTLLPDGRVLIIGGRHDGEATATAELWSPGTGHGQG